MLSSVAHASPLVLWLLIVLRSILLRLQHRRARTIPTFAKTKGNRANGLLHIPLKNRPGSVPGNSPSTSTVQKRANRATPSRPSPFVPTLNPPTEQIVPRRAQYPTDARTILLSLDVPPRTSNAFPSRPTFASSNLTLTRRKAAGLGRQR